ncbi:DUF6985 domain-containing protein [Hymenobacter convexus]|uniref:DUF6985 domain-containing protein n=1 Tax=Hymenobacter sp. CA1UV-4 TaxID=3063782 RepID=UPI002714191D|nr:hypothetical protein [Hymenobacter sp. CA1UV-4]MDO7852037.1 hypothetical protein [Hymenobacter sp. CA1UV-4]
MMTADDTLAPPFPPFEWDDYYWAGAVKLPAWAGQRAWQNGAGAANDTVEIQVNTENDEPGPAMPSQAAAFEYLIARQEEVRDAILHALFASYSDNYLVWREENGYDEAEADEFLPALRQPANLKSLITLTAITIFPTAKGGLSYAGYTFACTWEDEHGLGAMMHGSRVVEIGGGDTAILEWIATKDLEEQA